MSQMFALIPGVQAMSLRVSSVPMTGNFSTVPFWLDDEPKPITPAEMKWELSYIIEPTYLDVMRIPLVHGRFLTERDHERSPHVIVIDDQFARRHFGDRNPVGRHINIDILNTSAEIVGVVRHVRQSGLDESAASPYLAQCYLSVFQIPEQFVPFAAKDIAMVFRTRESPLAIVSSIRQALEQVDGHAVLYGMRSMDQVIAEKLATRRFSMVVLGVFAGLALMMACIGISGVVAQLVSERTQEIALRVALGAEPGAVSRLVIREGVTMAAAGAAIGLALALALSRLIAGMLFGISPHDPAAVATVAALLMGVATGACYLPARRAARIDPIVVLKNA